MNKNEMKTRELKKTSEIKRNSWGAGFEQFGVRKQIRESEVMSIETSLKSRKKEIKIQPRQSLEDNRRLSNTCRVSAGEVKLGGA